MSSQHDSHPSNRLARETSPYLLQHAHNPVDWWPWGPEAFAEARRRNLPIFLSIGYSTCYWCHVMERESFESADIARIMNERYICIKVDREERPDVDDLYMAAVQAFSGHGGWPMSVFLEPDRLRPFWAGTYFPAEPRFQNMPTFPDVLVGVSEAWTDQREEVLKQAEQLAAAASERAAELHAPRKVGEGHISRAVAELIKMHDARWGGFGGAPKFPQPVFLELLMDVRRVSGDDSTTTAIDAATRTTLDRMACGGMFDQIGGGFHRYSVDAQWLVPHFEKMLYDNAQLAEIYARAAILYQDPWYARIAERTCDYVLREMTDRDTGAFFSAQDAEVDGREGKNYLWSRAEVLDALGPEDAAFVAAAYGLDSGPNFRDPHHPEEPASNVLWMAERPEKLAAAANLALPEFLSRLDAANTRLCEIRSHRKQPRLDDKAIASWNGLMIRALATCGALLRRPDYIVAAARAADSLLHNMHAADGGLLRSYRSGHAKTPAFLEDYAAVIAGLLALAAAGAGDRFAPHAVRLAAQVRTRFGGPGGGLFDTLDHQPDLFVRPRASFDGAMPSGVGVMIHSWIELADLTGESTFAQAASGALASISGAIDRTPLGTANATRALLRLLVSHRSALESALASADDAPADFTDAVEPVEILTSVQEVTVSEHKRGGLVLRVRIAEGFHVAAADPGDGQPVSGLTPFRVHMVNGGGVAIYADYPPGDPFGDEGELRVYHGTFDLPVILERQGVWTGRPLIAVTYQACTQDACQAARTVELDVSVDRD